MSARYRLISYAKADNAGRPCKVPGCGRARHGVGGYCGSHGSTFYDHGHPQGRAITRAEYAEHCGAVARLLERNAEHPGVLAALAFLDDWKAKGAEGVPGTVALRSAHWMSAHGVSSLAILTEAGGLWLFASDNPRALPDDARLTYALAHVVMRLAPREATGVCPSGRATFRRFGGNAKRELGDFLREALCPLFCNLTNHFDALRRQARERSEAMRAPLDPQRPSALAEAAPALARSGPSLPPNPSTGSIG